MSDAQELLVIVNFLDFGRRVSGGNHNHSILMDTTLLRLLGAYPPQGYPPQAYPTQGYPQAGYPPPNGHPPAGYPPPGGYPPARYPPPGGYPPARYPPLVDTHHQHILPQGHGGPSMGRLIAGGAAAAYGAHHLSHGGHHSSHGSHQLSHGHHHGKFKHGKFGKHKKHEKHHGGKVPEVQEMEVIL
ncbi:unnamed protein product [Camellia sinensis]